MSEERSIHRGGLSFAASRQRLSLPGGWRDATERIVAYDGEWTRQFWGQGPRENVQGFGVMLHRGSPDATRGFGRSIAPHPPHTL